MQGVRGAAKKKDVVCRTLEKEEATTAAVLKALPKTRVAHLATHGFFADPSFRSAFQVDHDLFKLGWRGERVGAGALSPMVMTGLVFAGANQPGTPGRGIVTGEALVDLDLSGLELAVLSACETGLGDMAGGEGTFGLQRAFHLAGTRDVVASLWKVPDRPTAALMALFYRNLWDKELPPVEALRQALGAGRGEAMRSGLTSPAGIAPAWTNGWRRYPALRRLIEPAALLSQRIARASRKPRSLLRSVGASPKRSAAWQPGPPSSQLPPRSTRPEPATESVHSSTPPTESVHSHRFPWRS
jgi:hypothetical protein